MKQTVSFEKLKLTNNMLDKNSQVFSFVYFFPVISFYRFIFFYFLVKCPEPLNNLKHLNLMYFKNILLKKYIKVGTFSEKHTSTHFFV